MQQDDFVLSKDNFGTILKRRPLLVQVVLKRLVDLRYGSLTITLPDGEVVEIKGQEPGPNAHITMKSYDLMKRVLKSGGVGVGESFMDGEWTSPNVAEFLQLFCVNHHLMFASQRKFITGLVLKAIHWSNRNTKKQAKRNISAHYDLGNDFYKKWLDSTMTYSSAIFEKEGQSLSQAQILEPILKKKKDKFILVKMTMFLKSDAAGVDLLSSLHLKLDARLLA